MTIEEIEILVTAKVEEALKEIQKMAPAIKKAVKDAQEAMSNIDTKALGKKINQAGVLAKKKIQDMRKSAENNKINLTVNNKEAQKQISQIQKQIDSLNEKINARQMKLNIINPQIDKIVEDTRNTVVPDGISKNDKSMDTVINNSLSSNKDFTTLSNQAQKLYTEIEMYNKQLEIAKTNMSKLKQETGQTASFQNKLSSFFSSFKQKIEQTKPSLSNIANYFKGLPKITQNITNNIRGMGKGLKQGLGHVLKYVGALFSMQSIYSALSNSANAWLSSQNAQAQQLNTNIEYLKNSFGGILAPAIEYVVNLVYQLMKAIQSLVYALSGVNIFANASAKAYSSMANSAKEANKETKQLSGVHSEINNIQSNNNNSTGAGGAISPSVDLSQIDNQMSPFAQKLYDFFKPLVDSWNTYGSGLIEQVRVTASQIGELLNGVWGSFENIITNGTVYSILENILAIIGNIAQAWANAWNYNGNGDVIVQNLANAFNNLLTAINNVVQSPEFQEWLNNCSNKFREISEKIASINWQPLIDALSQIGQSIGSIALEILNGLVNIFKWFVEHPDVAIIIISIATAITLMINTMKAISGILDTIKMISSAWKGLSTIFSAVWKGISTIISSITSTIGGIALVVTGAITAISSFVSMLSDGFSWLKEVIMLVGIAITAVGAVILGVPAAVAAVVAAVVAVVATVIVVVKEHWTEICNALASAWEWIKQKAEEIWNGIKDFLVNLWQGICDTATIIWTNIKDFFTNIWTNISTFISNVWNGIKNIAISIWNGITTTISNVITGIKNTISNVLNTIKTVWNNVWNGIKTTVSNIWNGIWTVIKSVINTILGGIESFVNGVIKGINFILSGISKIANAVGSLIGLNPISLQLSTISIPRLAKGGIIDSPTIAMMGEYPGANTNPEIVTPQNIMEETFDRVLSRYQKDDNTPIYLTVNVGNAKLGQILLNDLRNMKRRSGKDIEVIVGG